MEIGLNIDDVQTWALPFVRLHGIRGEFQTDRIPAGGNNRVYRLRTGVGDRVLKVYFRSPSDSRDRLGAERSFYDFAWGSGVRRTPEPFGWDTENQLGLFSFVEGRKLEPDEVNESAVGQALDFVVELNRSRNEAIAQNVPVASEACFKVEDHLEIVQRRVTRLRQIEPFSVIDSEAAAFVRDQLEPLWTKIRDAIAKGMERDGLRRLLSQNERCLSPSDFGFHNALRRGDGTLMFFDFEYAGWDDPAKLICDFFSQPQIPTASSYWDMFVGRLSSGLSGVSLRDRAELLLPAYQIKWCCIMLNEFLRSDWGRREFALGEGAAEKRKASQLVAVRRMLALTQNSIYGTAA